MTDRTIRYDDAEWRLVPITATPDMESAGAPYTSKPDDDEQQGWPAHDRASWAWDDMLAAAPAEPPAQQPEPVGWLYTNNRSGHVTFYAPGQLPSDDEGYIIEPVYRHPSDTDAEWLASLPNEDERKWEQIEAWARASYRSHRSAIRGQTVTRADAYEHHVACAALRWARENPEPPARPQRPYGTDTMSEYGVIPECDGPEPPAQQPHPDDAAVDAFAAAMKSKLAMARAKGRGGWQDKGECSQVYLSTLLRHHVEKGDPRDVANFCCFLWNRGEGIGKGESDE